MPGTKFLGRTLLWVVRLMVGVIPAVVVLCFGLLYIIQCVMVLTNPGVPVRIRYMAAEGPAEIYVSSYSVDIGRLFLTAHQLRVYTPGQPSAVSAERLTVMQTGARTDVNLNSVTGKVIRRKDGTIDLQKFGLKPTGKPDTSITHISVDKAEIEFLDEATLHPIGHPLVLRGLKAEGAYGDWTAKVDVTGLGLTGLPVSVLAEKSGRVVLNAKVNGQDVAPAVRQLMADGYIPNQAGWSLGSLNVDGIGGVVVLGQHIAADGNLTLIGKGITYPGWIQNATISGKVSGNGERWSGDIKVATTGLNGTFKGTGSVGTKLALDGLVTASVNDVSSLPSQIKARVPKDVRFGGFNAKGRVAWLDNRPIGTLDWTAKSVQFRDASVTGLSGKGVSDGTYATLDLAEAHLGQGAVEGRVRYGLKDQTLRGFVRSKGDVSKLLTAFMPKEVTVAGSVSALIGGTAPKLTVDVLAQGNGAYQIDATHTVKLDKATLRASMVGSDFRVTGEGSGASGSLSLSGLVKDLGKQLDLNVDLRNLTLASYDPKWTGTGEASGHIGGSIQSPLADVNARAVGIQVNGIEVPVAQGTFQYKDSILSLVSGEALAKGGRVTASGNWNPKTDLLAGQFQGEGFSLSQIGLTGSFGRVDVSNGRLSGSLKDPVASANASVGSAYLAHYKLDGATAKVAFAGGQGKVTDLIARADQGTLTGTANVSADSMEWSADVQANKIPLDHLRLDVAEASPAGSISGKAHVTGKSTTVDTGTAEFSLEDGSMFGQSIGSGALNATVTKGVVNATGSVGDLDKYIQLTTGKYDISTGLGQFSMDATNVNLGQLLKSAVARNDSWNSNLKRTLKTIDAVVSARIEGDNYMQPEKVAGTPVHPTMPSSPAPHAKPGPFKFRVPVLLAHRITFEGHPAGQIEANFSQNANQWKLNAFSWKDKSSAATANGEWNIGGIISGDLSLTGLDSDIIRSIVPSVPLRSGKLSELTVQLEGTSDKPMARGSATMVGLVFNDTKGNAIQAPLDLSLYDAVFQDNLLTVDGNFNVNSKERAPGQPELDLPVHGLTGSIRATLPVEAFDEGSTKEYNVDVRLTKPRPASLLAAFMPSLDPKKLTGEISGSLLVHGRKDETHFNGVASLGKSADGTPAGFSTKNGEFALKNIEASVKVSETEATLDATSNTTNDKPAKFNLKATYPDLIADGFSVDDLMDETFLAGYGEIDTDVKASLPMAARPSSTKVMAQMAVSGSLRAPEVSGDVTLSAADFSLPLFFEPGAAGGPPTIDPVFRNIKLHLADGARVDAPLASLVLNEATGTISGRLSAPVFNMPLEVEKGTIKLPANRIRLEPGSQVIVALNRSGEPRLDLDVRGHTIYTKKTSQDQYQTYDLNLTIAGNLLGKDPLRIGGSSDPQGISEDEIQAIITQRSLIESLVGTATGQSDANATRNTLYSLAVPSLSDFLTAPIAESLGLDFLTLDYNPFDQAVVNAGKSLGKGFMVQFTRQLSTPLNGLPRQELRLNYRLPTRDRFLSQLSFSLTTTQTVPWRVGVIWGGRF